MQRYLLAAVWGVCIFLRRSSPAAAEVALSGKMVLFNYLMGSTWNCSVSRPALGKSPAKATSFSATFHIVRDNIVHEHDVSVHAFGDDYFGYRQKDNWYWHIGASSEGVITEAYSRDANTYFGYEFSAPFRGRIRYAETYTTVNQNTRKASLLVVPRGHKLILQALCTR